MKTVIFDFDGTIADSFMLSVEIAHKLTGHDALANQDEINELKKGSMVEVAKELNVPKYMWPFLLYRGRNMITSRLSEVKPFSGTDELLGGLHKHGIRIYIVSTNSTKNIRRFLAANDLRKYIDRVYGGVGLLNKPRAIRKVLLRNKLKLSDVMYVGDELRDIEAARDTNIKVTAVTWGFNDETRLVNESPSFIAKSRKKLLEILLEWGELKT